MGCKQLCVQFIEVFLKEAGMLSFVAFFLLEYRCNIGEF